MENDPRTAKARELYDAERTISMTSWVNAPASVRRSFLARIAPDDVMVSREDAKRALERVLERIALDSLVIIGLSEAWDQELDNIVNHKKEKN